MGFVTNIRYVMALFECLNGSSHAWRAPWQKWIRFRQWWLAFKRQSDHWVKALLAKDDLWWSLHCLADGNDKFFWEDPLFQCKTEEPRAKEVNKGRVTVSVIMQEMVNSAVMHQIHEYLEEALSTKSASPSGITKGFPKFPPHRHFRTGHKYRQVGLWGV